jgi:hypothetical protein
MREGDEGEETIVGVTGAGAPVEEEKKDEVIDEPVVEKKEEIDVNAPVEEEKKDEVIDAPVVGKLSIRKINDVNDVNPGETVYIIVKTAGGDVVIKNYAGENVTDTIDPKTKETIFDFINPAASTGQGGGRRRSRRNRRQNGKRQSKKRQQNRQSKNKKQNGGKKRRNSKRNQKK